MKSSESLSIAEKCGCGTMYVHIRHKEGALVDVQMHLGKQGTCPRVLCETITGLINEMIKKDIGIRTIIKCLDNHSCGKQMKNRKGGTTRSCADCIAQALKEFENEYAQSA